MDDYPITIYMVPKEILEEAIAKNQAKIAEPEILSMKEFWHLQSGQSRRVYMEERRKGDRRRG